MTNLLVTVSKLSFNKHVQKVKESRIENYFFHEKIGVVTQFLLAKTCKTFCFCSSQEEK